MTELEEGLRMLVEHPATAPEPVAELRRRVDVRRRRRATRRAAVAGLAVAAMAVVVVPLLDRADTGPTRVATGPAPDATTNATTDATTNITTNTTTAALVFVAGIPVDTRLEYSVPAGWQVLYSDGHKVILSTRPLSDGDQALALLARADAAFTALVPDAVVVVVGGDGTEAKYGTNWDGTPIDPGPPFALGPERVLPGGVRFRRGDVPQSIVRIASYAGPAAPVNRLREAEAVAAGIRQVRIGDPSVPIPRPPAGSTLGLPGGPLPVGEQGLPEVARAGAGSSSLVVVAGSDCAYMRDAGPQSQYQEPVAGGCGARPTGSGIAVVGRVALLRGGPGTPPSSAVIMRVGAGVARVSVRTADGRSLTPVLGTDGWGIAVGTGRIVGLTAFDAAGRQVSEAFVQ